MTEIPVGAIIPFGGDYSETLQPSWLFCNGQSLRQEDYPELFKAIGQAWGRGDNPATTFNVPDLQGQFLRGVANGNAMDPDRDKRHALKGKNGNTGDRVGSYQDDDFMNHLHGENSPNPGGNGSWTFSNEQAWTSSGQRGWGATTDSAGGNETRPKNAYVNYIIKVKHD